MAEVITVPPVDHVPMFREQVVEFLQGRVVLAQTWIPGVGLFEVRNPTVRYALVQHPPFPLGDDYFLCFYNHDEGESFRGTQGFSKGWLMFLGVPLDYCNGNNLAQAIGSFGKFHYCQEYDPYLVRTMVYASFPEPILVPRSVVFNDYSEWGGARVSWTAACYVLGANFADQMLEDEDHMPLDGNPYSMPGELLHEPHNFVLPPYPAVGWNDVPAPAQQQNNEGNHEEGNWEQEVPVAEEVVSQESMVLNISESSGSIQVREEIAQLAIVPNQPPCFRSKISLLVGS